jgi:hypothetical protein
LNENESLFTHGSNSIRLNTNEIRFFSNTIKLGYYTGGTATKVYGHDFTGKLVDVNLSGGTNITVSATTDNIVISAFDPNDCELSYEESSHFITGAVSVSTGIVCNNWFVTSNGTNANAGTTSFGTDSTEKGYGVVGINAGTTSTGRSRLNTGANSFLFGSGTQFQLSMRVGLSALSNGTDRFTAQHGFMDSSTAVAQTDGAYFRYVDNVNGGKWEAITVNNTVETATDTGVSPTAGQFDLFKIVVNGSGNEVLFYINNVLVATHTTNIPTSAGRNTALGVGIWKSAGTTDVSTNIDYYKLKATRTTGL